MVTISNITNETKVVKKLILVIIFVILLKLKVRDISGWAVQIHCYFIINWPFNTRTKKSFFRLGRVGKVGLIPSQDEIFIPKLLASELLI